MSFFWIYFDEYLYLPVYLQVYHFYQKRLYFDYLNKKNSRKYPNITKINKSKSYDIVYHMLRFNIQLSLMIVHLRLFKSLKYLVLQRLNTGPYFHMAILIDSSNIKSI